MGNPRKVITVEDIKNILVPLFTVVEEYNYDPDTIVARMDTEAIPEDESNAVEYMRELLVNLIPEAIIVDAGGVYKKNDFHISYGWWIQFKI